MKKPLYDLIVGNVEGAKDVNEDLNSITDHAADEKKQEGQAVVTRQQTRLKVTKPVKPLSIPEGIDVAVPVGTKMQADDDSLTHVWEKTQSTQQPHDSCFFTSNGLLYRRETKKKKTPLQQLVLPKPLRDRMMKVAHESIMSGHQGIARTMDRASAHFWWPGMTGDVQRY